MKTFTVRSNMIMLHGTLSGLMLMHDMNPANWIDLTDKDVLAYAEAVDDFSMDYEDWFTKHWRLFPFGEANYRNLSVLQQEMVQGVLEQLHAATFWYGENLQARPA